MVELIEIAQSIKVKEKDLKLGHFIGPNGDLYVGLEISREGSQVELENVHIFGYKIWSGIMLGMYKDFIAGIDGSYNSNLENNNRIIPRLKLNLSQSKLETFCSAEF